MKAGIFIYHDETDGALVVAGYVAQDGYHYINDSQTLTYTGAVTGSTVFTNTMSDGTHNHQNHIQDYLLVSEKKLTPTPGKQYTFSTKLTGVNEGTSSPSVTVGYVEPPIPPHNPTGLTFNVITSSGGTFSWTEPSNWGGEDTNKYVVEFSKSSTFLSKTTFAVENATTLTVTTLDPGTLYYIRVRAVNSAGPGLSTPTASFTTKTGGPPAPFGVIVSNITADGAKVTWSLTVPPVGDPPITTAEVQVSPTVGFANPISFTPTDTNFQHRMTGLQPDTFYYLRVRARTASLVGEWSPGETFRTKKSGAKARKGAAFVDVPAYVKVGGVMKPVAPQRRQGGVWVY